MFWYERYRVRRGEYLLVWWLEVLIENSIIDAVPFLSWEEAFNEACKMGNARLQKAAERQRRLVNLQQQFQSYSFAIRNWL